MPHRFAVHITLPDSAPAEDVSKIVAGALHDLAGSLTFASVPLAPERDRGRVIDANGNTIGRWTSDHVPNS